MLRGRNPNESPGIIQSVVESCRWNSSETYDIWDMVHGIYGIWLLNRKSRKMRFHLRFQLCILMISFRFAATAAEAPIRPPL